MPEAHEVEKQQRDTWDRFSAGWIKWDPQVVEMLAPVGREMIRLLALTDDNEHLDIASGTGEPGLSIAAQMPRGRVVLTDLRRPCWQGPARKPRSGISAMSKCESVAWIISLSKTRPSIA